MPNLITVSSATEVLELDLDKCNGYGNCVFAAPEIFELDLASNLPLFVKDEWAEDERAAVVAAVGDCPANALRIHRRED